MAGRILFGKKLQEKLGTIFEQAGFSLSMVETESLEALGYERKIASSSRPDRVTFHGVEPEEVKVYGENYIYAYAVSGRNPFASLKHLKELLPNFKSLKYPEYTRWAYIDEKGLDKSLDEIAALVKDKLLPWFENPVGYTSGLKKSEEDLEKAIESLERLADECRAKGRDEEAEKYENLAEAYREQLPE